MLILALVGIIKMFPSLAHTCYVYDKGHIMRFLLYFSHVSIDNTQTIKQNFKTQFSISTNINHFGRQKILRDNVTETKRSSITLENHRVSDITKSKS